MTSSIVLVSEDKSTVFTTSKVVAEEFGKQHFHVLRDIRVVLESIGGHTTGGCSSSGQMFTESTYTSPQGKDLPCYNLSHDGLMLLVMSYDTPKAMKVKLRFIEQFNKYEQHLRELLAQQKQQELAWKATRRTVALDFRSMNVALDEYRQSVNKKPNKFSYSNEANMLNKIILGMTSAEFKASVGSDDREVLRDNLTKDQLDAFEDLQQINKVLISVGLSYKERKEKLIDRFITKHRKLLAQ